MLMITFLMGKSPATAGLVGVLTAIGAGFVLILLKNSSLI